MAKRRGCLPAWYDNSDVGGSGTRLAVSGVLTVVFCFLRVEGTWTQSSCQKRSRTALSFRREHSRKRWSVNPHPKQPLNPSEIWLISTVLTCHQRSFSIDFGLNGLFSLRCIIKMHLTGRDVRLNGLFSLRCIIKMHRTGRDFTTGMLSNTKGGYQFFNSVALVGQSLKGGDRMLPQSLKFPFLEKRNDESGQIW